MKFLCFLRLLYYMGKKGWIYNLPRVVLSMEVLHIPVISIDHTRARTGVT